MKIGFIGCGNMASAMISGMLKKGLYKKDEIIVSNLTEEGSKRTTCKDTNKNHKNRHCQYCNRNTTSKHHTSHYTPRS